MSEPPHNGAEASPARMRIGTADREAAVSRLNTGLAEGRIDLAEFEERMTAVYAARTEIELVPLLADLPLTGPPDEPRPASGPVAARGRARDRDRTWARERSGRAGGGDTDWLYYAWRAWALAVTINIAIWAVVSLSGGLAYFWPMWVAGPWGAVLVVNTVFRKRP